MYFKKKLSRKGMKGGERFICGCVLLKGPFLGADRRKERRGIEVKI
jgi:hypothetical protein